MKEIFSETSRTSTRKERVGYFEQWYSSNKGWSYGIKAPRIKIELVDFRCGDHGALSSTQSYELGTIPQAYDTKSYLMGRVIVSIRKKKPQKEVRGRTFRLDAPDLIVAMLSQDRDALSKLAERFELPKVRPLEKR